MDRGAGKNLILDLDGTLVDAQYPAGACSALVLGRAAPAHVCGRELGHLRIYKRPGVDAFLTWCFEHFDNVGIWTLSSRQWLDEVLDQVFPNFPKNRWSLLWTGERATRIRGRKQGEEIVMQGHAVVKDLKKVFRNKTLVKAGFSRFNTLIVEDTPENCFRNYGNAVYVHPFDILAQQHRDEELLNLQLYFQKTLFHVSDFRAVEKRGWRKEIKKFQEAPVKKSDTVAFWMSEKWKPPSLINITARSLL